MTPKTLHALNQLNLAFYQAIAVDWSAHRTHAWPGFDKLLDLLPNAEAGATLRVLDVGAGDGRFGAHLAQRAWTRRVEYLGLDASPALGATAQARKLGAGYRFAHFDFVTEEPATRLSNDRFDLIVLFGVMHHVPSLALRQRLIAHLAQPLAPGGMLAMTFWRLAEDPRFERRILPWEQHNLRASRTVCTADLEPGDTLLRWGNADAPPRYCHFADEAEIETLIACSGLPLMTRFRADGRDDRLNDYVVLRRPHP